MESSSTRRQATRAKLYEAAVTLIAEKGFSATTVDEIAERAGVAKGTVYYNFASKAELFEELLRHGVGLLTASLREAAERTAEQGGSKVDALDGMIRAGLVFIDTYPAFTDVATQVHADGVHPTALGSEAWASYLDTMLFGGQ